MNDSRSDQDILYTVTFCVVVWKETEGNFWRSLIENNFLLLIKFVMVKRIII